MNQKRPRSGVLDRQMRRQMQSSENTRRLTNPDTLVLGPATLRGLTSTVELGGAPASARRIGAPGDGSVERLRIDVEFERLAADGIDAGILRASITNTGSQPAELAGVAPLHTDAAAGLELGADLESWAFFRNGYQSWSGTQAFRLDQADKDLPLELLRATTTDLANPTSGIAGNFRSDLVGVVADEQSGASLCVGTLDASDAFFSVRLDARGGEFASFAAVVELDGVSLAAGQTRQLPAIWIGAGLDTWQLLCAWADAVGAAMRARVPRRPPTGWCSWYYYFTRVSEADVRENLAAIRDLGDAVSLDYVMVDDGHQSAIGDWLDTNDKFPSGMAALASDIRGAGFDAGIWIAPFLADPASRLARDHQEWLLVDASNQTERPVSAIWNPAWKKLSVMHALDPTHPEVELWLEELARTLVRDWGYRILKLDFLYAASLPADRHDPSSTRASALRRGLEAIRRGAGEDAFLLGCGCPLGPAVGVVDAMRIGADVATWWSNPLTRAVGRDRHGVSTKHAVRNTLTRSFMHGRLWANDPDCLMVRDDKTRLTDAEVRSLATAIGLSDGMVVVSDAVDRLAPDRIDMIATTQSLAGGRSRVVDPLSDMPELIVVQRRGEGRAETLVGISNFADYPASKCVDLGSLSIEDGEYRDLWTGRVVTVRAGRALVGRVEPHDSVVIALADRRL